MIVLGLTGSIGMGKSTVAAQLASLGAGVCNADAIVHSLLAKGGGAVDVVEKNFPGVVKNGAVDRAALGAIVFYDAIKMKTLEAILHPLVVAAENAFIEEKRRAGAKLAVLDMPLLYETGAEKRCDKVLVVSAPYFIQKRRVLARPGMSEEKFNRIVSQQMPDREKRARADFVVQTGFGKAYSLWQLKRLIKVLDVA